MQLPRLNHRLPDGSSGLLDLGHDGRIVEDAAGHLAVPPAQTQDEVEGRLLLDVVVGEGAAVLELLPGEDQALLIGRNACVNVDTV